MTERSKHSCAMRRRVLERDDRYGAGDAEFPLPALIDPDRIRQQAVRAANRVVADARAEDIKTAVRRALAYATAGRITGVQHFLFCIALQAVYVEIKAQRRFAISHEIERRAQFAVSIEFDKLRGGA